MAKILVVDDEEDIVLLLKTYFEREGYLVLTAYNSDQALAKMSEKPDLVLLDIMMPGKNGYEICKEIRTVIDCPIIFLTAKTENQDIIKGLNLGADDYLLKPFVLKELRARVNAHLRREERRNTVRKNVICEHNIIIDLTSGEVTVKGQQLLLTPKELYVLIFLAENQGQTFSKEQMYEKIWDYDKEGESRTIAEHIKNIRKKMNALGEDREYITTVWGIGYRWNQEK